jgi:hypothetical protein
LDRSGGHAGRPAGVLADRPTRRQVAEDLDEPVIEPGAPASQEVAGRVVAAIRVLAETAANHEQELGRHHDHRRR